MATEWLLAAGAAYATFHWGAPWAVRRAFRVPRHRERHDPSRFKLPFETLTLLTEHGKQLFGWFIPAPVVPAPAVILVHGWGGNAEFMLPLAPLLHAAGYSVLLFDARCHGSSDDDDFASMPRFAEDIEHAVNWLRGRPEIDAGRIALLGHSVGAAAALLVASRRTDIAAVVSLAAFAHPAEVMGQMLRANHIPYWPVGWWVLRHVERAIGARFDAIAPIHTIRQVRCPVLLIHGEADCTVPFADVLALYAARTDERTELLAIADADHFAIQRLRRQAPEWIGFLDRALVGAD